jgi:hypothetical protein
MRSLSEILYTNNVLFSYYGFIDAKVLTQVLIITRSKLENNKESVIVVKRVYNAINECVENIIKHNFFPEDALLNYKSLLLVSESKNYYSIDTINVINSKQKEAIIEKFKSLDSKTKDELQKIKFEILSNNQYSKVSTAGLGLVDLILKTSDFNYHFKEYNENFLFSINFKINKSS